MAAAVIIDASASPSTDAGHEDFENMLRYSTLTSHQSSEQGGAPASHHHRFEHKHLHHQHQHQPLSSRPGLSAGRYPESFESHKPASAPHEPRRSPPEQRFPPHPPATRDDSFLPPRSDFPPPPSSVFPQERYQPDPLGSTVFGASNRPPSESDSVMRPLSPALSSGPDPEIERLENTMNALCLTMKRELLAEFSRAKASLAARHAAELDALRHRHSQEIWDLQSQLEDLRARVAVCDSTIDSKDRLIESLTAAAAAERTKRNQQQQLFHWRVAAIDRKREEFASRLAAMHAKRAMMRNAFHTWRMSIVNNWRSRVERACQARAREVCEALTRDHEANTQALHETIRQQSAQIAVMQTQRAGFEDQMKRALMRGVCALNMEAMGMFGEESETSGAAGTSTDAAIAHLSVSAPARPFMGVPTPSFSSFTPHPAPSTTAPNQFSSVRTASQTYPTHHGAAPPSAPPSAPPAAAASTFAAPAPRVSVPVPARPPVPPTNISSSQGSSSHSAHSAAATRGQGTAVRRPNAPAQPNAVVVERHVPSARVIRALP
eukprot:m.159905 g.159905  ORF g.159905 m.159905 type:complete len:549 (+) comp15185_c0_seq3:206-1852(+)